MTTRLTYEIIHSFGRKGFIQTNDLISYVLIRRAVVATTDDVTTLGLNPLFVGDGSLLDPLEEERLFNNCVALKDLHLLLN